MNSLETYWGDYYFLGLLFKVRSLQGKLVATMPGVPAGYEVRLEPVGEDSFINLGGPADGSVAKFMRDPSGKVVAMRVGPIELARVDPDVLRYLPVAPRILAPEIVFTPQKTKAFEHIFQACITNPQGETIDYQLPYSKYEFIQYVSDKQAVIFHGSNHTDIEIFQPVRTSMELMDESGRGNVAGVYGTHDGLWAMFFAIINRGQLKGSIRNGVMYFRNEAGETLATYHFSINQEQLEEIPVTDGALYFLPRDSFTRLHLTPDSVANEWACEEPVEPIARLLLKPSDFPFLDQIGGHDDQQLLRLDAISMEIREAAISASFVDDRFEVVLPAGQIGASKWEEYLDLQRVLAPAARFQVEPSQEGVKLRVTSLPPAMRQIMEKKYQALLQAPRG